MTSGREVAKRWSSTTNLLSGIEVVGFAVWGTDVIYLKYILNKTFVLLVLVWILIRFYVYNKVYRQSLYRPFVCMFSIRFHLYGIYLFWVFSFPFQEISEKGYSILSM